MSRELKFRIWNKQTKSFIENGSSLHCFSHFMIDAFSGEVYDAIGEFSEKDEENDYRNLQKDPNYYIEGAQIIKENRYVIQQFTGLKDQNNTEIYEGDIVQFKHEVGLNDWDIQKETVAFENGGFNINWAFDNNFCDECEVIGHIFQNGIGK